MNPGGSVYVTVRIAVDLVIAMRRPPASIDPVAFRFLTRRPPKPPDSTDRLYLVQGGALVGYWYLVSCGVYQHVGRRVWSMRLVGKSWHETGLPRCTIRRFDGWRYRWWDREAERRSGT